jgi:hypothetical protein
MKLVMTLLVRNEADIIAANIDFHIAKGVDLIIAMDNLSSDETAELLRDYERRGLVHYLFQPDDDYMQHRWVTGMARLAVTKFGADWVINGDADEFWCPDSGDLKASLKAIPPRYDAVEVERSNFLPRLNQSGQFFAEVMTVRERRSVNALGKPLPGKICHRGFDDIEVSQGNHAVRRRGHECPSARAPITILHFPMRSYQQFADKIALGGAAYSRNIDLPAYIGSTWRHLYQVWQKGELKDYFLSLIPSEMEIERELREGRFVRDTRLAEFFAGRSHSQ